MNKELRCSNKKHAEVIEPGVGGIIEVKCDSKFCGAGAGAVILHRFEVSTQNLIETRYYKDPQRK